jgi:TetR/AcrR family acrAB operon transcriptional repressor
MSDFENPIPLPIDRKAATRVQILQSALMAFSEKGYHQTTMDDIVARSGLSKGALYWHFKGKKELFIALVEWFMLQFGEEISHAWTEDMSAADKIRTMVMVSVEGSEQLIPFFKVFLDFWAQTSEDEQLRQIFESLIEDYQNQIGKIIEEGMASGEFRPVKEPRKLSLALFGMIDALFLYQTLLEDKVDMRGSAEAALDVIIEGLRRKE